MSKVTYADFGVDQTAIQEWEISAQLDLALNHYALLRNLLLDTWYVSLIWENHFVISYDWRASTYEALLVALTELYRENGADV